MKITIKQHDICQTRKKIYFGPNGPRNRPQDPNSQQTRAVNNSRRDYSYVFIFITLINKYYLCSGLKALILTNFNPNV